jgi:tetratricopeptide (TPR) repeat protein
MKRSVYLLAVFAAAVLLLSPCAVAQTTARSDAESLFIEAQKALARGDAETAESLLKETLARDPEFTSAIWQLAQIYERQGRLDYAKALLTRGLGQDPQASWAREKLAQIEGTLSSKLLADAKAHVRAGDYAQAAGDLSNYLGIKQNDADALAMMGTCQLKTGNPDAARDYFGKALALDPRNETATAAMRDLDKRDRAARLETLVAEAQVILLRLTPVNSDSARTALGAVLSADPNNAWAADQLAGIDRFLAEERLRATKRSVPPARAVVEKSREAIGDTKNALTPMATFLIEHLTLLILAAVLAVLVIDVRRRMARRSHPLEGTISLIPVLDIVSLINANLRTGRLIVVNPDMKGEIFFEKGEIIHAQSGRLDGKKAFHALMDMRSGRYFFHNHLPRVRRTITEPFSMLLLSMRPGEDSIVELEHEVGSEATLVRSR